MWKIGKILNAEQLMDKAFRRAKKKKGSEKIEEIRKTLNESLRRYVRDFPSFDNIHPFYYELIDLLVGINKMKKSLSSVEWARKKILLLSRDGIKKIRKGEDARKTVIDLYGRISSLLRQIDEDLKFLENARFKISKMPSVSTDIPTIIIAGYPNVGKSSILSILSKAKPEIAPYPFTTKGLVLGHFHINKDYEEKKIQIIEAPGMLDRPIEEKNEIEKQAIVALKHLPKAIIFVLDASMHCGYPLKNQLNLLEEVKKMFKVKIIVVENKVDLSGGKTDYIKISCKSGEGIEELKEKIKELV
ncbi:MAG: 50S ribosome-binding GTPase [Thermoplasmatales archaeon]|nr:50S ribosome-binding GTPase [Thermoplasmatales archaeon]